MPITELAVTAADATAVALLAYYFFRAGTTTAAEVTGNGQAATVVVRGGYQPDAVQAHTGSPLLVSFDRREDGDCSSRVVFPDLGVNRFLAPFTTTNVELPTERPGTFEFSCGMNMLHGTVVVEGDPVEPSGLETEYGPATSSGGHTRS